MTCGLNDYPNRIHPATFRSNYHQGRSTMRPTKERIVNMYTWIFSKVLSQIIRAFLIGTIPYFLAKVMGYEIVYWHFLVIAYCADIFAQLTTDLSKSFAKWSKEHTTQSVH